VAAACGLSNVDGIGTVTRSTPGEQVDVSVRYSNPTQQVRICASCPVRRPCVQDALIYEDEDQLRAGVLIPPRTRPA